MSLLFGKSHFWREEAGIVLNGGKKTEEKEGGGGEKENDDFPSPRILEGERREGGEEEGSLSPPRAMAATEETRKCARNSRLAPAGGKQTGARAAEVGVIIRARKNAPYTRN